MSIQLFIDKWLSRFTQSHFEWLLTFTVLVTLAWIALAIFTYWRRAATNLTPVDVPSANRNATPDFLSVDKKKQKQALARGDEYAAQIESTNKPMRKTSMARKICGWMALAMAVVVLTVVVAGTVCPESVAGSWIKASMAGA